MTGSVAEVAEPSELLRLITCIDCGGRAHLITRLQYRDEDTGAMVEDVPQPGDVLVYRCEDCLDRWDLVVPDDDGDTAP